MSERESKTRSRALRSYVFATFKTRSTEELVEFLPILVARMVHEKTPKGTIQEVVQQFLDYLEIKEVPLTPELLALKHTPREGVTCVVPELDAVKKQIDPEDKLTLDLEGGLLTDDPLGFFGTSVEDDGIVDLEGPLSQETVSPLVPFLVPLLDRCWEKSTLDKFPKFLWKEFVFEGNRYYAIASWKMHGQGVDWNLAASYSDGIVYSSKSEILARHEGRAVHLSRDFNDFELVIPPVLKKSKYTGQKMLVSGTLFVWALTWKQGVEVRCWLNESIGGKRSATGDLIRQSKVMPHFPG
jgi:hypothetical protein